MEKGMVRCDVNVSVRPKGSEGLGAKIEIKNMNSFSGVRRALLHEIPRQIEVLGRGKALVQETRRWDDSGGITESMRSKEQAHDYRYLPDPDLMPLAPTEAWLAEVGARVVELPLARKRRFQQDYQLPDGDASTFKSDVRLADYFEPLARRSRNPKAVANWVINNLRSELAERSMDLAEVRFLPEGILELVELVDGGRISSKMAQEVFSEMFETGTPAGTIVERRGLTQVSDAVAIDRYCEEAIAANPRSVADYRAGKSAALNFLKGQVMKLSQGKANPSLAGATLERKLRGGGTSGSG
jgi:aspartyl-tRNA(Asn)/glutamyl-tRNA(Gln) amidotransferase subunit B